MCDEEVGFLDFWIFPALELKQNFIMTPKTELRRALCQALLKLLPAGIAGKEENVSVTMSEI